MNYEIQRRILGKFCNRNGKEHDYDIVIGAMANDQVYNYIFDYIARKTKNTRVDIGISFIYQ